MFLYAQTTHVKELCDTQEDVLQLVDHRAGSWPTELAFSCYRLCLKLWAERKRRYNMEQVFIEKTLSTVNARVSCLKFVFKCAVISRASAPS